MDTENRTANSRCGPAKCSGRGRQSERVETKSRFASVPKDSRSMESTGLNETWSAAGEDAIPVVPVVWNAW